MTLKNTTNPFPIEAVVTYGHILRTCEGLDYMMQAQHEMSSYLINFSESDLRYGGAIGLRGAHGSGKTHLLTWLSQKAEQMTHIKPIVLYAKADRANFFDSYNQLIAQLPKEKVQQLFGEAVRQLGIEQVVQAKASESLKERITSTEDLSTLNAEGNLDVDSLYIQLKDRLELALKNELGTSEIPVEIPRTLIQINSPTLGDEAYQWLLGKEVKELEALGLSHPLFRQNEPTGEGTSSDAMVVNVLETIAALLGLAGRPLILMIDQLEVLIRTNTARQLTLFSVLKKLVEQLGRQKALIFIAGNDESWDVLPRDVMPRLRWREPIQVGKLDLDKTRFFLKAYTASLENHFSSDQAETIWELSGGNPREILRIAYFAFEEVDGELNNVSKTMLIASAEKSGSINDRSKLALSLADSVLQLAGQDFILHKDLDIGDGVLLDRLLTLNGKPRLALALVRATSRVSEIDYARHVHYITRHIERNWPTVPLIVISIGYSSSEVDNLLRETSIVVRFDEANFLARLQSLVAETLAKQAAVSESEKQNNPELLKVLAGIAARLDQIESERQKEEEKVAERFRDKVQESSEPARRERELETRWDVLKAFDSVEGALLDGELEPERESMRKILIANETYLKLNYFDYLGVLYMDMLSADRDLLEYLARKRRSEDTAFSQIKKVVDSLRSELLGYRQDAMTEMKRILQPRFIDKWLERPVLYSSGAFFLGILISILIFLPSLILYLDAESYHTFTGFLSRYIGQIVFLVLMLASALIGGTLIAITARRKRWARARGLIKYIRHGYTDDLRQASLKAISA